MRLRTIAVLGLVFAMGFGLGAARQQLTTRFMRVYETARRGHFASTTTPPNPAAVRYPHNVAEFDRLFEEIKNWGRWGPDDQLGTVNLITAEERKKAIGLVQLGQTISLSRALITKVAPELDTADGTAFEHVMNAGLATDTYKIDYHSFLHAHLDALCHFSYKGMDYNGYPTPQVNTLHGCTKLGVENLRNGIITRGILIDIPLLRNIPWLEPGEPVFVEDIEAWEKFAAINIGPGDAIFLRTGRWARWEKLGPWHVSRQEAGFHPSVARWLKQRGVAVIGSDAGLDVLPSPVDGIPDMPMHVLTLNALGMPILDNHDLEALAGVAAGLHRWEFLVSIAPLVVTGGTGSPVNTVAVF
jgi:kynurenine formamidase